MIPAISMLATHIPTNLTVISGKPKPYKPPNPLHKTLNSLCKSGNLEEAVRLVESSPLYAVVGPESYSLLLHSCITKRSSKHGERLHKRILLSEDQNLLQDPTLMAKLITLYSVSGRLEDARQVFDDGLLRGGDLGESVWVAMAIGYSKNGCFSEALALYVDMLWRGVWQGNFAFSMALKACSELGDFRIGRGVHGQIVKSGGEADQVVYNALLSLNLQSGSFDEVLKLFDKMPQRNVVSWNSLIGGFIKEGKVFKALDVFRRMQIEGVQFSWVTLTIILPVCGQGTMLSYGKEIHAQILKAERRPDVLVMNSVIDMYFKCGIVDYGRKVFNDMRINDLTTWNTILTGYSINGCMAEATMLFAKMISSGARPDEVTFIILLSGCSHTGLVEEAQKLFRKMEVDFGISPGLEHYACLVDVLGRRGRIEQALEVVRNMPMEPGGSIWGSLLNACCLHGEVSLGEVVANRLFGLEPDNPGNYVLLSNIYANAGMWDQVNKVRDLMQEKGIKKDAGCSWVQTKSKIHTFVAGGAFEFQNSLEYKKMKSHLAEAMEEMGYAPDTGAVLHDINEEMKAAWLCGHSERLAAMYSLIHTADGMPIRIGKNLRICVDCHSWMKILSKVARRLITLRDTTRFHHFKEGVCSCKDYW